MTRGVRNEPPELKAGYGHKSRGVAAYVGVLRPYPTAKAVWTCACSPVHLTPVQAVWCATAELARRTQGEREVFTLLFCEPCGRWWTQGQAAAYPRAPEDRGHCPRCGYGLERVKLVVLERSRVS